MPRRVRLAIGERVYVDDFVVTARPSCADAGVVELTPLVEVAAGRYATTATSTIAVDVALTCDEATSGAADEVSFTARA